MNYFLILIIMGLCAGGFYEYSNLNQEYEADQKKITDLSGKVDWFQTEYKKLEDDKAELMKSVAADQAKITDLTKQVQDGQAALDEAKAQAAQMPKSATPAATTAVAPPPSNNLGTITTLDGKSHASCQLLKVKADGIVVNDADGITELAFTLLPPDMQKRFGFDPHVAATLTDAQVEYEEGQRQAASRTAGN
jgi:hypothetical protein